MKKLQCSKILKVITLFTLANFLCSTACSTAYPQTYAGVPMPDGPQGPPFANSPGAMKYDLLSYSSGSANSMGAFVPQTWPSHHVNNELQEYIPGAASQDSRTKEITITAKKESSRKITSARLETYGLWTTATSPQTKKRGYLEVRALLPAKTHGSSLKGAWPAIWMLGTGNGHDWPKHGEIDIVEVANGEPKLVLTIHSTNHNGGGGQHPPKNPLYLDADLTQVPGIFGFEWNIQDEIDQIDLTWWITHYDPSKGWTSEHTTKSLFSWNNSDYWDFFNSFDGEGFSLIVNLAEGGDFTGVHSYDETFVDGNPQHVVIKSALVYGVD